MSSNLEYGASMGADGAMAGSAAGPWGAILGGIPGTLGGALEGNKWFGGSQPAETPLAGLANQDWQYYQANIAPLQQQLFNTAMNPQTIANAVNQAKSDVSDAYTNSAAKMQRQAAGLGVTISPDEQQAMDRSSNVSEGLATTAAANNARAATRNQMQSLVGL